MSKAIVVPSERGDWRRKFHIELIWGTAVNIDIRGEEISSDADAAINDAVALMKSVDGWFSTFKADSDVSALRNGLRTETEMPEVVQAVIHNCRLLKESTAGAFDPWAIPDGVDFSGYVKGWAADLIANMLVEKGFANVAVNAGGDVAVRGLQAEQTPWKIGIRNPHVSDEVVAVVQSSHAAIATSGTYERGLHLHNPNSGSADVAMDAVTVVGPDGGQADAYATALLIAGTDGVEWFKGMPEWSGMLIKGEEVWKFGPAFA
jgi:thiamine biosynthesis lipoprotein